MEGTSGASVRSKDMAYGNLNELARQWVAEQGDEAGEHLAEAIRTLRAVGDARGARLLTRIAERIELLDGEAAHPMRRWQPIRRQRDTAFGSSG